MEVDIFFPNIIELFEFLLNFIDIAFASFKDFFSVEDIINLVD